MATCKPHQYQHYANGIARIRQCIQNCKEPATVRGTMFGDTFADDFSRITCVIENSVFDLVPFKGIMHYCGPPSASHTS